jgi:hypothetical protein
MEECTLGRPLLSACIAVCMPLDSVPPYFLHSSRKSGMWIIVIWSHIPPQNAGLIPTLYPTKVKHLSFGPVLRVFFIHPHRGVEVRWKKGRAHG